MFGRIWRLRRTGAATCRRASARREVRAGRSTCGPLGNGLEVMLEPLAVGLDSAGAADERAAASTRLCGTGYAAISVGESATDKYRLQLSGAGCGGWNPRRFRFAASASNFAAMSTAYQEYMKGRVRRGAAGGIGRSGEPVARGIGRPYWIHICAGNRRSGADCGDGGVASEHDAAHGGTVWRRQRHALGKVTWMQFRISWICRLGFSLLRACIVKTDSCK